VLFREEAVKRATVNSLGEVILTQPLSHKVLTAVFSCIGAALVLFLCLFSYTRKVSVSGVLLPTRGSTQLEADLYAPSGAAAFLEPGMPVQLRYTAYSYQKFGLAHGVVQEVASTAIRPEEINPSSGDFQPALASAPVYRVRVKLERQFVTVYGSKVPLRAGSTVDANILLERRRLIEWVF